MQKWLIIGLLAGISSLIQGEEIHNLPKVLIIGDSISIGYTDPLVKLLEGKAEVVHNPGNAQHSGHGLKNLEKWLGNTEWDVIHFNHGLHDLKYVDKKGKNADTNKNAHIQVDLLQYEKNLDGIVVQLKKTGAQLIFATTTPFPAGVKPLRIPEDVTKYNRAALKVMKKHQVAINDLYAFVLPKLKEFQKPENVHFTAQGSEALAKEVAKHIQKALGQQENSRAKK